MNSAPATTEQSADCTQDQPAALPAPPVHPTRLVYLGTPHMAVPPLRALVQAGFIVDLVVTRPDRRRGRRQQATPSPVKHEAQRLGLSVSHDVADAVSAARAGAELGVVVAFGEILRRPVLQALPMVNLHFSLLPRWRGAAPVERALLAGDLRTGVCVMAVEEGLDTGAVYAQTEVAVSPAATAAELSAELTDVGAALLVDTLRAGLVGAVVQQGEPVYAQKLHTSDLELHWPRPAGELDRVVRVGGAHTYFRGQRFKVHRAIPLPEPGPGVPGELHDDRVTTGQGVLQLIEVQAEGKARQLFAEWARGQRPEPGEALGAGEGSP